MVKASQFLMSVLLAASLLYAADNTTSSAPAGATISKPATTEQAAPKGAAKAKIVIPAQKTNWSKIKDLFM
jgi:hypothetical protein